MNTYKNQRSRGFTLIELLVVISILGLISSVALANLQTAKDKAKVAAGEQFHATLASSLGAETVAQWKFDEDVGTIASDSSGNGRDGVINGATYTSVGISGSALSFDGNDYITGDDFPNPGAGGNVTIIAWVKPTNIAVQNTLFSATGPSCTAVQVGVTGGATQAQNPIAMPPGEPEFAEEGGEVGPGGVVIANQPLTEDRVIVNNTWQNLAYVFNNGTISTFVNGSLRGVVTGVGTANCPGSSWVIGADGSFGYGYAGLIDDMRIYGSAFTASEIQKIYAEESEIRATLVSR